MLYDMTKLEDINIIAGAGQWPWQQAIRDIFTPRGVNVLVANKTIEFTDIAAHRRIHAAIIDADCDNEGLAVIKVFRIDFPLIPCIMLITKAQESFLGTALELDVFSVIEKPIDFDILRGQLNRLFIRNYNSTIFAQ